jgi:DNA-binding response OmpR family regulator
VGIDTPRVLIADGDQALRQQLHSRLLELDIAADCVSNVEEAIGKIAEHEYGLALVDVSLPGGNVERVIEAIALLRAVERPVVLILASNPSAARSLDVEIVQIVLRKPVAVRQLVELIGSCIRSAAPRTRANDGDGDHAIS